MLMCMFIIIEWVNVSMTKGYLKKKRGSKYVTYYNQTHILKYLCISSSKLIQVYTGGNKGNMLLSLYFNRFNF